jgi:hypothetical protein
MAARAKRTPERKLKRSAAATTQAPRRAKPSAKPKRKRARAAEPDALATDDD